MASRRQTILPSSSSPTGSLRLGLTCRMINWCSQVIRPPSSTYTNSNQCHRPRRRKWVMSYSQPPARRLLRPRAAISKDQATWISILRKSLPCSSMRTRTTAPRIMGRQMTSRRAVLHLKRKRNSKSRTWASILAMSSIMSRKMPTCSKMTNRWSQKTN